MSYTVKVVRGIVLVQLTAKVHTLDLLEVHNEAAFLDGVEASGRIIYDYSGAQSIQIDEEGVKQLAGLAAVISNLQDNVHIVIVPQDPANKTRALLYQQRVSASGWQVDIVDDLAQAFAVFEQA
ncbi:hypothetical protein LJ739_14080 [Aestuariibacter halophilus]|uniref:Uncharacterized protein n=1 Tax=Fluctibacter halophilus TaxID=226011 RepID=A0ABS8GBD3_9ALTE|nr:hypothetical protein [Aestuariibacter halophilus]MCC2617376.1 hypothetical protein [Aestuariibacter halophilus]